MVGLLEKLSREFSRTESRIVGSLSKLDDILQNQQENRLIDKFCEW